MYETIVLGATFLAAGIAARQKKSCLILEESFRAGYEFFGALNYGTNYDALPQEPEGKALYQQFFGQGVTAYMRNTYIYPILQAADVRFGTQVVSVEKEDDGFVCVTCGVDGFTSFRAKKVIDTRCNEEISCAKTYNLLVESGIKPRFPGIKRENTGIEDHYVLCCPVPLLCDYAQAREIAEKTIRQFSEGQRLILLADEFDYQVDGALTGEYNGIGRLPSKAYENPVSAFEAGLEV